MTPHHAVVIGSGPSGSVAAKVLLEAGWRVSLLDIGQTPDGDTVKRLSRTIESNSLSTDDRAFLRNQLLSTSVPLKSSFGSLHAYDIKSGIRDETGRETGVYPTAGFGGLSSVWGAAVLRLSEDDYVDWPIKQHDMSAHYDAVEALLNPAATKDSLFTAFPFNEDHCWSLPPSGQARQLLERLVESCKSQECKVGRSRLAISPTCRQCGTCILGCPFGSIFDSSILISVLRKSDRFSYYGNHEVVSVSEDERQGIVKCKEGSTYIAIRADRIIVAAGAIGSSRILLNSGVTRGPVLVRDSQYFLEPFFSFVRPHIGNQPISLSEIFIEMPPADGRPRHIHSQLYLQNEIVQQKLRNMLLVERLPILNSLASAIAQRLIIAQSYLHSDYSGYIEVVRDLGGHIRFHVRSKDDTPSHVKIARASLAKVMRKAGWYPIKPMGEIAAVGRGYHFGASFPMQRLPAAGNFSNLLGQPNGMRRVHIVDASIFPCIASGAPTLTAMANSHRVCTTIAREMTT